MRLILVGGFLGAGKTTLLWEIARRLTLRNETVGLITNDQAPNLVDTAILSRSGGSVREVAGSCFCCNFIGFHHAIKSLVTNGSTCILAEPVGSCTDLSATILQPLKDRYPEYRVAPLTVLVDPRRVCEVFVGEHALLHSDAAYILRLQLQEADRVLLTKADTLSEDERESLLLVLRDALPDTPVDVISAVTGEGVDGWLDKVLAGQAAGTRIVEVDYDRYANGEAVLGWLNAVAELRWTADTQPAWEEFVRQLFARLQSALKESGAEVGHVKVLLDAQSSRVTANLTGLDDTVRASMDGDLAAQKATMTINARVQTTPDDLENVVRHALTIAAHENVAAEIRAIHCLQPGRPVPTHRYASVVG